MSKKKTKHQIKTSEVLVEVYKERQSQNAKWGEQNHHPVEWYAILAEEIGEVAKEVVEFNHNPDIEARRIRIANMREELIQSAAVAVSMI